ncbi:MAG: RnfABCDGE type electron transport complex subunit G [Desulfobacterales bacterium]|nr:RnfABCDGE type electron transport complex subunit G [Desulfobacterales bacterium]
MAKIESSFKNMVLALPIITIISALAVTSVYLVTKEPIALAQKAKQERAIREVIPEFDELRTAQVTLDNQDVIHINKGLKGNELIGYAVETFSVKGYDPTPIKIMVGFKPDGKIINTAVIQQKETPGLGTKMAEPKFEDQFNEKHPEQFSLKVKKDGGDVDGITAATISSRAFCDAVNKAYNAIKKESKSDNEPS